jgi:alpha-galactosidase
LISTELTRREVLRLALATPALALLPEVIHGSSESAKGFGRQSLIKAPGFVVPVETQNAEKITLSRRWDGPLCHSRVVNSGSVPVALKEVVLFEVNLPLPSDTRLYGEGFQMLTQSGGTLAQPLDLGNYTDAKHYKLPAPTGAKAFYGMMTLASPDVGNVLFAFTSCRRFSGQFYLRGSSLQVVVDTEGLTLKPGESWELEEFTFVSGKDREQLLSQLAQRLTKNHPRLRVAEPPAGWCSWYCFGPRVTAQQVLDNLDFIARNSPGLKYIQIDDGYQPAMGDWLETGSAFGGNVQGVLHEITKRGFRPAIWVAPFIAEEKSHLFQQHPDWFVKDGEGKPLQSDRVTFGGWRHGPWYVLDGTHPEVQQHFEKVFRTMREEWGCSYFKLDANFWGAIHGGRFHDPRATRIEAYRRGMQAILRGAGESFVLGCNHPIWASLGLIHGSRSSNDIKRTWERIATTARQNLQRNWQNGRLWWNDPDAVVLTGDLPENEFRFHATAVYATGGMILSGDDLTKISSERLAMLRKLQPPTGIAARFTDDSLRVGSIKFPDREIHCLFNWDNSAQDMQLDLSRGCTVRDFWSEEDLGKKSGTFSVNVAPRSARLLVCS